MDLFVQLLINGLVLGARYSVVALGFALILKATKLFHFAHGAVFVVALYVLYLGSETLHLPLALAAVLSAAVAAGVGYLIERGINEPLRKRGASSMTLVVASLGILIVLQNLVLLIWGPNAQRVGDFSFAPLFQVGGVSLTSIDLITLVVSIGVCLLALWFLRRSKFGLELLAVSSNQERARLLGISPARVYRSVFAIASGLLVVPALLVAVENGVRPDQATDTVLIASIAAIVGGIGSVGGAVIGSFIIGIAESIAVWGFSSEWQETIAFVVLIVFILIRPTGLAGRRDAMNGV